MRTALPRWIALFALAALSLAAPCPARAEAPLIAQTGLSGSPSEITVLTLNPNLGDNIIFDQGLIPYLHERYPGARIQWTSPTGQILRAPGWLQVHDMPVQRFLEPSAIHTLLEDPNSLARMLIGAIDASVHPGSLVIWDDFRFERLGDDILHAAESSLKAEDYARLGGPRSWRANLQEMIRSQIAKAREHLLARIESGHSFGVGIEYLAARRRAAFILGPNLPRQTVYLPSAREQPPLGTMYEEAQNRAHQLFGADAKLEWDPALYLTPELSRAGASYLERTFGARNGPYLVLNLNTRGDFKVRELQQDYAQRLQKLLSVLREHHPELNILVSPPEAQFGEETVQAARQVIDGAVSSSGGRVALLPADRELWKPILQGAEAVISQDSGFVHVANIVNDHVITLFKSSMSDMGEPIRWRKPGQPVAVYRNSGDEWQRDLLERLDGMLCQDSVQRVLTDLVR
jgi:ADP-heptose:LPS heptosyltransferase